MKIVVTGGTGFIGSKLVASLRGKGHEVNVLSRFEDKTQGVFQWNYQQRSIDEEALEGVEGIFHLAGAPISQNWTASYKQELQESRIESLQYLDQKFQERQQSLQFLISASGVNYYGTQTSSKVYTENDPAGTDFLAQLCVAWENAVYQFQTSCAQKAILRTGVVVDKEGGAVKEMMPFFKIGMGALLGSGKQVMPCISLEDIVAMYNYVLEKQLKGVYNAVGFNLKQKQFARQLGKKIGKPVFLKVPSFVLEWGMGEMSNILLKGSAVNNEKILSTGFPLKNASMESINLR